MIRLLIADDHQIFRDGLLSMLQGVEGIQICGVAATTDEAAQRLLELSPDVLLLDISMPGKPGFEIMDFIRENGLKTKVLVLSMHTSREYIIKAIQSGVNGYLPKQDTMREELIKAVSLISEDKEYYHDNIRQIIQDHFIQKIKRKKNEGDADYHLLTKREKEIIKLVVEGLDNPEISAKLFISVRTVETHKTNIMQKLNLKNTVELVKFAIRNDLLEI